MNQKKRCACGEPILYFSPRHRGEECVYCVIKQEEEFKKEAERLELRKKKRNNK